MDQGEWSLPRNIPPHGLPSQHGHSSSNLLIDLLENSSLRESDQNPEDSSLENAALELYAEILLSRAHSLFSNSTRDDVNAQENLFDRGKEALEEAISLCFSGQYSVSKTLIAKCWYIRGFLADVSGDSENALRCFIQATNLDETYKSLERVRWHLQRQEDLEEMFEAWDDPDQAAETRNIVYRPGEPDSDDDTAMTTSSPGSNEPNFRQSELFQYLMYDINHKDLKEGQLIEGDPSVVTTSCRLHHLPPIATPYSATFMDTVDELVREKINSPGTEKRASRETHEVLKGFENSPVKDPFLVRLENSKKKARMEAEDRMRHIREARSRYPSAHSRQLSSQEVLLTDTPCIREPVTPVTHGEDGAASPPKLTIDTRGTRRPSTSKSSVRSPASLPSPLRKQSLPGDAQDAADGS